MINFQLTGTVEKIYINAIGKHEQKEREPEMKKKVDNNPHWLARKSS